MENIDEESLGSMFSVDTEKYSLKLLSDLNEASEQLSVCTWDALRRNKIYFVSDLLNVSPAHLMKLEGFTDENLNDIQNFVATLRWDQTAVQLSHTCNDGYMDSVKPISTELQKLKSCRICISFDIPFAQRYSIELKPHLNGHISDMPLPARIRKKLLIVELCYINDLLVLSPAQLIKNTKITLLDLPGIEDFIAEYIRKEYYVQTPAKEIGLELPVFISEKDAATSVDAGEASVLEEVKETVHVDSKAPCGSVSADENEKTFAQIYGIQAQLHQDNHISKLDLSNRTAKVFRNNKIETVADLLNKTPGQLMQLKNFGRTCLKEIEQLLEAAQNRCSSTEAEWMAELKSSSGKNNE
jgi:DNA-directed RNA polymerase alpha subunit